MKMASHRPFSQLSDKVQQLLQYLFSFSTLTHNMLPQSPRAPFLKEILNGHDPSSSLQCRRGHPTEADWGKLPSDLQGETRSVVSQAYLLYPLPLLTYIFKSRHGTALSEAALRRSSPEAPAETCYSVPHPPPLRAAEAVLPWPGWLLRSSAGYQMTCKAAAAQHCHIKYTCPNATYK